MNACMYAKGPVHMVKRYLGSYSEKMFRRVYN